MTTKQIAQIGFIILFTLIAQHLMATEETNSQNLTPFQQMQHLIKSNFDNDPNAPKYGKVIQISNRSFLQEGSPLYLGDYSKNLNILINKAVIRGLREAAYMNKRLRIYSSKVTVEDDMYSMRANPVLRVPHTIAGRTKMDCFERIDQYEMKPKGIDILISGRYRIAYNPTKVNLLLFVIDKRTSAVRSEQLNYPFEDITVRDSFSGRRILRSKVKNDITKSVRELLNYLPE